MNLFNDDYTSTKELHKNQMFQPLEAVQRNQAQFEQNIQMQENEMEMTKEKVVEILC